MTSSEGSGGGVRNKDQRNKQMNPLEGGKSTNVRHPVWTYMTVKGRRKNCRADSPEPICSFSLDGAGWGCTKFETAS